MINTQTMMSSRNECRKIFLFTVTMTSVPRYGAGLFYYKVFV